MDIDMRIVMVANKTGEKCKNYWTELILPNDLVLVYSRWEIESKEKFESVALHVYGL